MSLAMFLAKGAALGALTHGSLGYAIQETSERPIFIKSVTIGLITGVALAAIAYFGGQAAAVGAGLFTIGCNLFNLTSRNTLVVGPASKGSLGSISIGDPTSIGPGMEIMGMAFGASVGYTLGLINLGSLVVIL